MSLKKIFFTIIVKPFLILTMGLNIKNKERLPNGKNPKIIIANHNSHLDTLFIMSLFPNKIIDKVKPVGAKDYFYSNKYISWISKNLLDIIPLDRKVKEKDPLKSIYDSLDKGNIVIIFPEGSRGNPEELTSFKNGIHHIAKNKPDVEIIPIYMEGMGKSLPKNEALFVPFVGNVNIGKEIKFNKEEKREDFIKRLEKTMKKLKKEKVV